MSQEWDPTYLRVVINDFPALNDLFTFQTFLDPLATLGAHNDMSTRAKLQVSFSFFTQCTKSVGSGHSCGLLAFLHPAYRGVTMTSSVCYLSFRWYFFVNTHHSDMIKISQNCESKNKSEEYHTFLGTFENSPGGLFWVWGLHRDLGVFCSCCWRWWGKHRPVRGNKL